LIQDEAQAHNIDSIIAPALRTWEFCNTIPQTEFRSVLRDEFGLNMADDEIRTCMSVMELMGAKGAPHPFFA
jgi:hypothetical protein